MSLFLIVVDFELWEPEQQLVQVGWSTFPAKLELTQGLVGVLEVFDKDVPAGTAQVINQNLACLWQQVSGSEDRKHMGGTSIPI